jgi:hypothetical protein
LGSKSAETAKLLHEVRSACRFSLQERNRLVTLLPHLVGAAKLLQGAHTEFCLRGQFIRVFSLPFADQLPEHFDSAADVDDRRLEHSHLGVTGSAQENCSS